MKAVSLAALIALSGCVAGAPSTAPPTETTSVGAPTSLAPPVTYPTGRLPASYATPAMTTDNAYHPSWMVDVYGWR